MYPASKPTPHPALPGIVVGMQAEARLLNGLGYAILIGGGMPAGATAAAERLVNAGAPSLLSVGLAGGLDPALPPGARVVPAAVLRAGRIYQADLALTHRLGGITAPLLVTSESAVITARDKANLFASTGAAAVDLESAAVAEVAARRGVPFAVLRIVCDPATRDLPHAALAGLHGDGSITLLPLLASLLRRPAQLPALLRLAGDARIARAALHAARRYLTPHPGDSP